MKLKLDYTDTSWWHWTVSWVLIAAGLFGWEPGFLCVTAIAGWQVIYWAVIEKNVRSFPQQVLIGFFLLCLAGLWRPLRFLYWLPAIGLIARITVNYCPLARAMSLLPWNRRKPLTTELLRRTFLTPPVEGSILEHLQ